MISCNYVAKPQEVRFYTLLIDRYIGGGSSGSGSGGGGGGGSSDSGGISSIVPFLTHMYVWLYGCMVVWLYGCMVVCMCVCVDGRVYAMFSMPLRRRRWDGARGACPLSPLLVGEEEEDEDRLSVRRRKRGPPPGVVASRVVVSRIYI